MAVTTHPWTPKEINIVRESVALNRTAREIAQLLPGRTRNAVIGLKFRLGLATKRPPHMVRSKKKRQDQTPVVVELNPKADKPTLPLVNTTRPEGVVVHFPKPVSVEINNGKGKDVLLINRQRKQCAYITGLPAAEKTRCCGQLVYKNTSWCAYHRELIYVPARKKGAVSDGHRHGTGPRSWLFGGAVKGDGR